MKPILLSLASLTGLYVALPAQKMPLADESQRQVVVLDVGDLIGKAPPPALVSGRRAATTPSELQRVAAFVRAFAEPALGDGADLQPLGDRHLVVLGSAVQVAATERLVAHARTTRAKQFLLDVRLCTVPGAFFDRELAGKLAVAAGEPGQTGAGPHVAVLDAEAAAAITRAMRQDAQARVLQAPQIVVNTLHSATLQIGEQVSYVRDFEIEIVQGARIADPVVEVLFDGQQVEALCAEVDDGLIGVQMQVIDQSVEKPIRTIPSRVPGIEQELTLQVPRTTGCRGNQTALLPDGATAVMAARKNDGTWLLSLMTVNAIRAAVPIGPGERR